MAKHIHVHLHRTSDGGPGSGPHKGGGGGVTHFPGTEGTHFAGKPLQKPAPKTSESDPATKRRIEGQLRKSGGGITKTYPRGGTGSRKYVAPTRNPSQSGNPEKAAARRAANREPDSWRYPPSASRDETDGGPGSGPQKGGGGTQVGRLGIRTPKSSPASRTLHYVKLRQEGKSHEEASKTSGHDPYKRI
jgi:hypothetical protein